MVGEQARPGQAQNLGMAWNSMEPHENDTDTGMGRWQWEVALWTRIDNAGKQGTTVDLACQTMTRTRTCSADSGLDTSRTTRRRPFSKVGVCRAGSKSKSNRGRIIHPRRHNEARTRRYVNHIAQAGRFFFFFSESKCGKDPAGWRVCGACQNRSIGEHLSSQAGRRASFKLGKPNISTSARRAGLEAISLVKRPSRSICRVSQEMMYPIPSRRLDIWGFFPPNTISSPDDETRRSRRACRRDKRESVRHFRSAAKPTGERRGK